MSWHAMVASVLLSIMCVGVASASGKAHSRGNYVHWIDLRDAAGNTIDLSAEEGAKPYSPRQTCKVCHEYDEIAHGHHFNAMHRNVDPGRPGEPWIWTESAVGTQIPMSYRGWEGTYNPRALGISPREFVVKFGRHLPGGGPGEPELEAAQDTSPEGSADQPAGEGGDEAGGDGQEAEEENFKWKQSGNLEIDCMICHSRNGSHDGEAWQDQIAYENFAWAPTVALGMGSVKGMVSRLPDDFDPETAEPDSRYKLPQTTYAPLRTNADGKVFFDVVRKPPNTACYYCHTTRPVGGGVSPEWTHDEDVHLKAGMSCADCHRNDLAHHTVRGFDGEVHPTGQSVVTLSCRGCHMDESDEPGRMGAPKPLHKGLPPLHLEKLSCTACHSGPRPSEQAWQFQTAMAHGLGLKSNDYTPELPPGIVAPVMKRNDDGVLYPHRMMWPAFWGTSKDGKIKPLHPEVAYEGVRRACGTKRGEFLYEEFSSGELSSKEKNEVLGEDRAKVDESELTDEEKSKLADKVLENWKSAVAEALTSLKEEIAVGVKARTAVDGEAVEGEAVEGEKPEPPSPRDEVAYAAFKGEIEVGAEPVYVVGGKVFRLNEKGELETLKPEPGEFAAVEPYAWKFAHDVRPARQSSGVKGCYECHAAGSPILEGQVTAIGPAPDDEPITESMYAYSGYDKTKMDAWNLSFTSRSAFKYFGFAAMGVVGIVLLAYLVAGVNGLTGMLFRKKD